MMLAILAECWHHEVLTPLLMPLLRARHRSIARPAVVASSPPWFDVADESLCHQTRGERR